MDTTLTSTFPLALALRPTAAAGGAAAWFVPGRDPAGWLAEVVRWGVPTEGLRFYVVPSSPADPTPAGALVVPPAGQVPMDVRRGLPYRLVAGRLYVPADAELWPPVADAELAAALRLPVQVLHPSAGLSGFTAADALRAADLIARPTGRPTKWDRAYPGETVRPRIVSVEPADPPDVSYVLAAGRGDIGSAAPDALPRTPEESSLMEAARRAGVAPAKVAEAMAMGPLRFMAWLSRQLAAGVGKGSAAGGPAGKSWAERLRDWAAGKFNELQRNLQDERARELERLRRMMEDDPDEGLRHAIPIRNLPGRGVASPGGRLGTRDVNFSLGRAMGGGGGAVDRWDVPPDAVQDLTRRYREAANRELRLGRYRRAAYVLAELLGDFAAAASALEQGRHHREAAVLYRDKLNDPVKAAECLERGGLITEAAAAYEELKRYEPAGDLYARLGRADDAARCYRLAVAAHVERRDLLPAAGLLETKLAAPDEALVMLTNTWPDADAAGTYLKASFALLGRLGRHEAAADRARAVAATPVLPSLAGTLAKALSAVAAAYPDQGVRAAASDATRVAAAATLPHADAVDRRTIARAVADAAAEDRLLARDVERFLGVAPRPAAPGPRPSAGVTMVGRFRLPAGVRWSDAIAGFDGFFAGGFRDGDRGAYVLVRGTWAGTLQTIEFKNLIEHETPNRLHVLSFDEGLLLTARLASPAADDVRLPQTDTFPSALPVHLTKAIGAAGVDPGSGLIWILRWGVDREPVLSGFGPGDHTRLMQTHALPGVTWPDPVPDRLVVRRAVAYAPWGAGILRVNTYASEGPPQVIPTESTVTALASPTQLVDATEPIAAAMQEGGLLLRGDGRCQRFAEGLAGPAVAFTRGGALVAVAAATGAGRAYDVSGGHPRLLRQFDVAAGEAAPAVVAVTAAAKLDEFAVFAADGTVRVFRVDG